MIYTLNLSENFADKLVEMILSSSKNPFEIAQTQVILPTKRACRAVKEAFIHQCKNKSLLLPHLTALYDINTLEEDIPQAISKLERTLLLSRLCRLKPNIDTLEKGLMVAVSLGELLDEFYQFEANLDDLEKLVPNSEFAQHWNETIQFLEIIRTAWPTLLKERGQIDEMDRKIRLINAFTNKIIKNPPSHQIIIAGFDGAIPSVSRLICKLNEIGNNLILLHGFNSNLTTEDLKYISCNHYQYTFKKLIQILHFYPKQIKEVSNYILPQEKLIKEAFRPAEQTDKWRDTIFQKEVLKNIFRIDCESINEEALTIALILRKTLETPEKTATLVTNDRMLARRVILEMKRWNIELNDSAGTPLHHTPLGVFLSLIAQAGKELCDGISLLSLLKHPLAADCISPIELRLNIKKAEKIARQSHKKLLINLNTDLTNFSKLFEKEIPISFGLIFKEHLKIAEQLATSSDRSGSERLWNNEAGQTAYAFLTELGEYAPLLGEILPSTYPDIFVFLISSVSIRPNYGIHPRLNIFGPIEARLTHPDVCIISGLNEGTFPMLPDAGPWLSRQMRQALSLPSLETKIAVQEMDFAHCFCASEIYLTRSLKIDGSPTIPSRFLSRIEAVLQANDIQWEIQTPRLAQLMDTPNVFERIERPTPKPPVTTRPKKLSVTNIELLMRNPYAIYAKYILNLYPLDELECIEDHQVYGSAIHAVFENFLKESPYFTDSKELAEQIKIQLEKANMSDYSIAFFESKIEKIASFLVEIQKHRQNSTKEIIPETTGEITLLLEDGTPFTLFCKADRIDILKDNSIEIIDYKTGSLPTFNDIKNGFSPQLPLEALIVQKNGFTNISPTSNIKLSYWKLTGKKNGGELIPIPSSFQKTDVNELIESSFKGIINVLNEFNQETCAYEASPHPEKVKFNSYEQLSREKEWLTTDDMEEE